MRYKQNIFSNFRRTIFGLLILCAMLSPLGASGCKSFDAPTSHDSAAANLREVTDDLNRKVFVPTRIERVVSLAPSVTENVFAVGAGAKLVGVTTYCDFPAEARQINKIGDTLKPNLETIVALKPQLVLASTDSQLEAFIRSMEAQRIPVFVTDAKTLDDVFADLRQLGDLLGTNEQTEKLVAELMLRARAINEKVENQPRIKTFFQVSPEPFTVGRQSFITDLIERAGGASVTADVSDAYFKLSRETAVALQPEVIVLAVNDSMGAANREPFDQLKTSPAVKNNRVYKLDGDLLARPSPRLVDGLEAMAKALHPEVFR